MSQRRNKNCPMTTLLDSSPRSVVDALRGDRTKRPLIDTASAAGLRSLLDDGIYSVLGAEQLELATRGPRRLPAPRCWRNGHHVLHDGTASRRPRRPDSSTAQCRAVDRPRLRRRTVCLACGGRDQRPARAPRPTRERRAGPVGHRPRSPLRHAVACAGRDPGPMAPRSSASRAIQRLAGGNVVLRDVVDLVIGNTTGDVASIALFDVTTSPLGEGAERSMRYHALVQTLRTSHDAPSHLYLLHRDRRTLGARRRLRDARAECRRGACHASATCGVFDDPLLHRRLTEEYVNELIDRERRASRVSSPMTTAVPRRPRVSRRGGSRPSTTRRVVRSSRPASGADRFVGRRQPRGASSATPHCDEWRTQPLSTITGAVRDELADQMLRAASGYARDGSLSHWLASAPHPVIGLVTAEAVNWATQLQEITDGLHSNRGRSHQATPTTTSPPLARRCALVATSSLIATRRADHRARALAVRRARAPDRVCGPISRSTRSPTTTAWRPRATSGSGPRRASVSRVDGTMADLRAGARDLVRTAVAQRRQRRSIGGVRIDEGPR